MLISDLWGISFHAVVVFGLGKNFLFKSALEHCDDIMHTRAQCGQKPFDVTSAYKFEFDFKILVIILSQIHKCLKFRKH